MSKFSTELMKNKRTSFMENLQNSMDEESFNDFELAMKDPNISAVAIVNALKACDVQVSENTVRRWRKSL